MNARRVRLANTWTKQDKQLAHPVSQDRGLTSLEETKQMIVINVALERFQTQLRQQMPVLVMTALQVCWALFSLFWVHAHKGTILT